MSCKDCEIKAVKSCFCCNMNGCGNCVKEVCCDCCVNMCKPCINNYYNLCGCYGDCTSCGKQVDRGTNGWPCDNCESWLCDNCFENNWNKNCKECKSKYEDI